MRSGRGFTLIELLVGVVIAGVLLAITVPGFVRFRSTMLRSQVKWALIADLRYARQLAVTKHRPVIVGFGNGSATTNITTYTLHTDNNSNRIAESNEPRLFRTLPKGALLTSVTMEPPDSVIFDSSGSLWPGTLGGQLAFRGPQGYSDTLIVSAIGMIFRP